MKMLKTSEQRSGVVDTVFRMLASLIFVMAGLGHIMRPESIVNQLEASAIGAIVASLAPASLLVVVTGVVLLVGGVALLLGAGTRVAAVILIGCLIPITISVQLEPGQMGPLFKNVALFGMLLHFANAGALHHAFSLDALWTRRRLRSGAPEEVRA